LYGKNREEAKIATNQLDQKSAAAQESAAARTTASIDCLENRPDFFEALFAHSRDMMILHEWTDEQRPGRILEVNQAACDTLGYSRKELLQMTPTDFEAPLDPNEAAEIGQVVAEKGEYTFETVLVSNSGKQIPVEVSCRMLTIGDRQLVLSASRDITERKKAQTTQRLMQLSVDQAADAVLWFAPDRRLRYVNHEACMLLGGTEAELLTKKISDVVPSMSEANLRKFWRDLEQWRSYKMETALRDKNGNSIPVELLVNYLQSDESAFCCAFARTIEERLQAQEALEESEAK
jgi:PAS domain S-box-containing protein